jgi:hypothetical protein
MRIMGLKRIKLEGDKHASAGRKNDYVLPVTV